MSKESVRTHLKKAEKLQKVGSMLEAYAEYEAITQKWPTNVQASKQKSTIGDAMLAAPSLAFQPLLDLLNAGDYSRGVDLANSVQDLFNHDAEVMNLSAALNMKLGDMDKALRLFEKAVALAPSRAKFRNNLATLMHASKNSDGAITQLRKSVELAPNDASAHWRLGLALTEAGFAVSARASFSNAYACDPGKFSYYLASKTMTNTLHKSVSEMNLERSVIEKNLSSITETNSGEAAPVYSNISFMPSYHGSSNIELFKKYNKILRKNYPALKFKTGQRENEHPKIRLGICSNFLYRHTIGKLFQGHVTEIDRDRFHLIVIRSPSSQKDNLSDYIDQHAEQVVDLPPDLVDQQELVSDLELDCLFYPELGMAPDTLLLAHARLAPVQAMGWGHPDTTGIPTIDYFLSSELLEPPEAQNEYSEHLIKFSRLPSFYSASSEKQPVFTRDELGLPANGRLYGCPQSLYKFHPDFDQALAKILAQDPNGWIILVEGRNKTWNSALMDRWDTFHPALSKRAIFLPRLPHAEFISLLRHCAVLLDPFPFGSGNTMYEAMEIGTPIVTLPGKFMRGRCVYGAYRQMGLDSAPIAKDIDDYARLAVEIANDDTRRAKLAAELKEAAREHLFEDTGAIREFEAFVQAAVQAARSGELLSGSWSASQLSQ